QWTDNSGSGNTVSAPSVASSPTLSSGVNPGVSFNAVDQFMMNASANMSFGAGKATLLVVRIADNDVIEQQNIPTYHTTISISPDNTWNDELSMQTDAVAHHSSSGNWTERHHQCYSSLPETEPAIITGIFTGKPGGIDMQVNGIATTAGVLSWGGPWDMASVNRRIRIGARTTGGPSPSFMFEGTILEVLAYDHVLTAAELTSVSDYLKCKHAIQYTTCNNPIDCSVPTSINGVNKQPNMLYQNAGNPFNISTTVAYQINHMSSNAAIQVYDLNGKVIRNYAISRAGSGSVEITAEGLAPGMYFYSLIVDGAKAGTKRMVVSK
ncbi:MAG: T9SS type A sorting domain-containing protein, partial [Sphingobacteriales bacterium]